MKQVLISYDNTDAREPDGAAELQSSLRPYKHDVFVIGVGGTGAYVTAALVKMLGKADFRSSSFLLDGDTEEKERRSALRAFAQSAACAVVSGADEKPPLTDEWLRDAIRERYTRTRGRFRPIPIICRAPRTTDWIEQEQELLTGVQTRLPLLFDESADGQVFLRQFIRSIRGLDTEPSEEWQHGLLRRAVRLRAANALNVAWEKLGSALRPSLHDNDEARVWLGGGTSAPSDSKIRKAEDTWRTQYIKCHAHGYKGYIRNASSIAHDKVPNDLEHFTTLLKGLYGPGHEASPSRECDRDGISGWLIGALMRYVFMLIRGMGVGAARNRRQSPPIKPHETEKIARWEVSVVNAHLTSNPLCIGPSSQPYTQQAAWPMSEVHRAKGRDWALGYASFYRGDRHLCPPLWSAPATAIPDARSALIGIHTYADALTAEDIFHEEVKRALAGSAGIKRAGARVSRRTPFGRPGREVLFLVTSRHQREYARLLHETALRRRYGNGSVDGWLAAAPSPGLCMIDGLDEGDFEAVADRLGCVPLSTDYANCLGIDEAAAWRPRLEGSYRWYVVYVFDTCHPGAAADEAPRLWTPDGAREEEHGRTREPADVEESLEDEGLTRRRGLCVPVPRVSSSARVPRGR